MSGRPARATTERSGADGRFGRLRLCLADSFPKTSRIFNVTGVPGAAAACSLVKFSANTDASDCGGLPQVSCVFSV